MNSLNVNSNIVPYAQYIACDSHLSDDHVRFKVSVIYVGIDSL